MKNTGLKNRFSDGVKFHWHFWYACMVCGRNCWDALHHIISPSVRFYVDGKHNESILNSCPIHNNGCHIGNEHILFDEKQLKRLLRKTLLGLVELNYRFTPLDYQFMSVYKALYDEQLMQSYGII